MNSVDASLNIYYMQKEERERARRAAGVQERAAFRESRMKQPFVSLRCNWPKKGNTCVASRPPTPTILKPYHGAGGTAARGARKILRVGGAFFH